MRSSGGYARRDSGHYGANAVQPAFGGSPPEYPGCTAGGFPFIHLPNGMRLKGKGLSHGLKKSPPDSFLRQLRCRRPFESQLMYQKRGHPGRYARRDSGHYGANAVQPAFGGSPPDDPGCTAGGFPFIHIPNGMRLKGKGLSHGLKKCPPDSFLRQLRCRRPFESQLMYQKRGHPERMTSFLVRQKGLEPPTLGTGIRCSIH